MMGRTARYAGLVILWSCSLAGWSQTMQEHVHRHAQDVMPFDLGKTVHVFRMTESGGVQSVVTRGDAADTEQLALIRHHLMHEAMQFQAGDFSDPAKLHGPGMPGLAELHAGAGAIKVTFRPLPNGAEVEFKSTDIKLITAIHRWFGAQLSEHGADAMAK